MKQIKYILLAGTIITGSTGFSYAEGPAAHPMILAQAVPPAEETPDPRKQRQERPAGAQQPRGERQQRAPEGAPRGERQEAPARTERPQAPPRAERPQRPDGQEAPPRAERTQRPDAPPRREAPPAAERAAPPAEAPPVPRATPPAATPDAPPAPRGERAPRPDAEPRGERQVRPERAPAPDAANPSEPPVPRDARPPRRAPDTPPPPAAGGTDQPPAPSPRGERPGTPRGDAPATPGGAQRTAPEAPSVIPAPPPAGESPAIPPEELRGERTPEQRQRAERRVEEEFRNRDRGLDKRFDRRVDEESGGRTVIREGDSRVIIREGDRTIIRTDQTDRMRRNAEDFRQERGRNDEVVSVIRRPGGIEIVTVTDRDGNLIRRSRREGGREIVIIDNSRAWERGGRWNRDSGWRDRGNRDRRGPYVDFYLDLPPVRIDIPRDEYIIDADEASYEDYEEALIAPPLVRTERPYSLQEVTQNVRLRERVRSIDLNTVNFATGEWSVADDQIDKLEELARALKAVIDRNPNEVYLVEGHTDAVGSALDNLSLSDRRAEEVAAILTEYYEVPAENLVTQGYGEDYLKVNTVAANGENRRVTIRNITALLNAEAQ